MRFIAKKEKKRKEKVRKLLKVASQDSITDTILYFKTYMHT